MALLNPYTNLRVDNNFVHQITNFKKYGKKDEKLIKEIIIYLSLNFQKNLFGEVDIDPIDFCKQMNVDRAYLFRKHENPIFFRIFNEKTKKEHIELEEKYGNISKFRIWDNHFENALLILQYEKFYFSTENIENDDSVIQLLNFTYIKSLKFKFVKTGKTNRVVYQYIPTEEFEKKLYKFFINIDLNNYIKLRRASLEDLYLKLIYRIRNESRKNNDELFYNIKELALLMNISVQNIDNVEKKGFSDVKRNINRKIKKYFFENIQGYNKSVFEKEFPQLKFEWRKTFKNGRFSKYKNLAVFSWKSKTKKEKIKEDNIIYDDIFFTKLLQSLSENYSDNYKRFEIDKNKLIKDFLNWLLSEKDFDIKVSKFISLYSDIKGNKTISKSKSIDFFNSLIKIGKINKTHNIITFNEETLKFTFLNEDKNTTFQYSYLKDLIHDLTENSSFFEKKYKTLFFS